MSDRSKIDVDTHMGPITSRLVVHIGRHKTGTSSLQWTLHEAGSELARAGWLYPVAGRDPRGAGAPSVVAHHALGQEVLSGSSGPIQKSFRAEIAASGDRVLVSSESMQNISAKDLAEVFPPSETTIVVYLREQVSYVLSGYAQLVQAQNTTESFESYARRVLKSIDHLERLDDLASIYGHQNVIARIYESDRLEGGSTISDFLALVGLSSAVPVTRRDSNPSIGAELVLYKRLVNAVGSDSEGLYNQLSVAAADHTAGANTVAISAALQNEIRARFIDSNNEMFSRWFGEPNGRFDYRDFSRAPERLTHDELVEMVYGIARRIVDNPSPPA